MKNHDLKTDPAVFADVLSGAKTFEIRFNDRDFQPGDTLRLLETEHDGADMRSGAPLIYTGREVTKTVSHILTGYGLADGWCCLSFVQSAPAGMTLVPCKFVTGFYALAHNYSMKAEAPDYYYGTERDAFSYAYARCGSDLIDLRRLLAA